MINEQHRVAYDGWKDLHTWSSDDSFHWAVPKTISSEHINTNNLPEVVEKTGFNLPSMMLITSLIIAIKGGVKLDDALASYADQQISLALTEEKIHPGDLSVNRDWLWNLRQFGVEHIPDEFGVRDLTENELYEFKSALQNGGIHPLRYFHARPYSKILQAYTPESSEPYDLGAKFLEREAFINTLLFESALYQIAEKDPLFTIIRETNDALCREIGRDLPTNNKGMRSHPDDRVSMRVMGEEEGQIEVTPPEKVEMALSELATIHNKWKSLTTEEKVKTAKKHFIKMWAGITTIQPLSHQNNRTAFMVAHQLTREHTKRLLPSGAFTGGLSVKSEFDLYRDERYRNPTTLCPTEESLEIIANNINFEWVNQAQFVQGVRSNGFIRERPWLNKLKWRT